MYRLSAFILAATAATLLAVPAQAMILKASVGGGLRIDQQYGEDPGRISFETSAGIKLPLTSRLWLAPEVGIGIVATDPVVGLVHAGPTLAVDVIRDQLSIGYKPAFLVRTDLDAVGFSNTLRFGLQNDIVPIDLRYDVLWEGGEPNHVVQLRVGFDLGALIDQGQAA